MIRFLVMDVDGTLTDGKIYMGQNGELFKAFDIKDGYAIKCMLPERNIIPIIITARKSTIVELRAQELGISECYQDCFNKLQLLTQIIESYSIKDNIQYSLSDVLYIGDDLLDLQCMAPIHAAKGIVACPADAAKEVKDIADHISKKNGGQGAIRDTIEWLISKI